MSTERKSATEIDNLVDAFKNGNQAAGIELLKSFTSYIEKYFSVIKIGEFSYIDKTIRRFVCLYTSNKNMKKIISSGKVNTVYKAVFQKSLNYINQLFLKVENEDIKEDLILAFYEVVNAYQNIGEHSHFTGYFHNVYKYYVYRELSKYIDKDMIRYNDDVYEYFKEDDEAFEIARNFLLDNSFMTNQSFLEDTDSLFSILSISEKKLLILKYVDKKSDTYIGELYFIHRHTVRKKINTIKEKLLDYCQLYHLINK